MRRAPPRSSLLEVCFTNSRRAGLLCVAKQTQSVSEARWAFGLGMPSLPRCGGREGGGAGVRHLPRRLVEGEEEGHWVQGTLCSGGVLRPGRTLGRRPSLSLCWWSEVEQKP